MKIVLEKNAFIPLRGHPADAGLDLRIPEGEDIYVPSFGRVTVDTGVRVEIPEGHVGLLTSKSGIMQKKGIISSGTIDCGYTGTIKAILINTGAHCEVFRPGDKITQLVILPCETPELEIVTELEKTERGNNGFGSTGR